jgi:integrase
MPEIYEIQKKGVRADLPYRPEPYWKVLGQGKHLGFRKARDGRGYWIAKFRSQTIKRQTNPLGECTADFDFDQAKELAEKWFKEVSTGVVRDGSYTVERACADYVIDRRSERGDSCAQDKESRIRAGVLPHPIAKRRCIDVMADDLRAFRDGASGGKRTKNAKLKLLKSALYCAVRGNKVSGEKALEWKKCPPYGKDVLQKEGSGKREVYLTVKERRALIAQVVPEVAEMLRAAATTGARPGEIARAKVKQYDRRTGVLTILGKTGERKIDLSDSARGVFDKASLNMNSNAWLFPNLENGEWLAWDWGWEIKRATRILKLPKGTCMYTFRHCFITDQLNEGNWSALEVAKYCGTSLQMINDHYGHLTNKIKDKLGRVAMI